MLYNTYSNNAYHCGYDDCGTPPCWSCDCGGTAAGDERKDLEMVYVEEDLAEIHGVISCIKVQSISKTIQFSFL